MDPLVLRLSLAYLIDLRLGDPRWLPHPVKGLGWAIRKGEDFLRSWIKNEILAGWLLVLGIALGSWGFIRLLLWGSQGIASWLPGLLEVTILYFCLSTRDLAVESSPVLRALESKDIALARRKVAMIVGRDTDRLNEPELVRATVETIAESTMDGIVSPLFFGSIGGAPLAFLYKAVNTLDSMVGNRSGRYIRFGKAAAWVDTWMNWIPARITALLIAVSGTLSGSSGKGAFQVLFRDAWYQGENSILPEAAMAGSLGVQLGGINFYQSRAIEVPRLGDPIHPLEASLIGKAIRIMFFSSFLGFLLTLILRWGIVTRI